MLQRRTRSVFLVAILVLGMASGALALTSPPPGESASEEGARVDIPLANWPAPSTYTPARSPGTRALMNDVSPYALAFSPLTPCRLVDTRAGQGFTGQAGPPSLGANAARGFAVTGTVAGIPTQCGVPPQTWAVSLNIAVTNMTSNGNLIVYAGGAPPSSSAVNWTPASVVVSGATVVGLSGASISAVFNGPAGAHVDVIIDVNGYYSTMANTATSGFEWFSSNPAGYAVVGANSSSTDFSKGVEGIASSATGRTSGVFGLTISTSTDAAGVLGRDSHASGIGSTHLNDTSGVRGEGANGVMGITQAAYYNLGATVGEFLTGTTLNTFGVLGRDSTTGVFASGNLVATGTKSFVDPHPSDPRKVIDYVALEGPEAGTYFRGTAQIVHGVAVIQVPEHFAMVTDPEGLTIQLTPVGAASSMFVEQEGLDVIVVRASRDVKFHYLVQGVRSAFRDHQPIAESDAFIPRSATARMPTAFSAEQKRRLVANGTFNADGTPNEETARALGWAKVWEEKGQPGRSPSN